MYLKLSFYGLKIDYKTSVRCKPHDNYKTNTYSRYTKRKEEGIKVYHHRRSINKRREQEREIGIKKLQNSQKTMNE